ncbi:hypothetical protein BG261_03490 [Floricoccus tropicus]|uniref:DUF1905 domain-containing protein n=1 Tax=Floricoccus tropicus TaxID=1859473 RepID=A0A1E8GQ95_9LACT|nr:DUF1905 domain-containing protein [Floricoccus tropicus]OFI49658.1 hypothetical protein BG261_03490 [Floricoccus tropicus]
MTSQKIKFQAKLLKNPDMDASYIEIPFDVEALFGKKRVLVDVLIDGFSYHGQLVRMKTECHILGVRREIRKSINKTYGDTVNIELKERIK